MTEQRTRIAVVGAGFGRYALGPAFQRDSRCEVVAVCARSETSAGRLASELKVSRRYTDPTAMLDAGGIDAVAIATPPHVQPDVTELAISRSMHVFVEKLLALSVERAQSLDAAARQAQVANVVDYIFPELEAWTRARALIADGSIGRVRQVSINWMIESYDNRLGLATWKTDSEMGGGALQHFGPHVMYNLEWLIGPITALSASLMNAPDLSRPGDTAVAISLEFASGAAGFIAMSTAAPLGTGHRVEIYGSEGALILVNESRDFVRGFRLLRGNKATKGLEEVPLSAPAVIDETLDARIEPVSRIVGRFVDWIRTGKETRPSFRDGLRVQRLLEAAKHSHRSGSRVVVPHD